MPECNICSGIQFEPGPGGRIGAGGTLPKCKSCGSLERDRVNFQAISRLAPDLEFGVTAFGIGQKRYSENRVGWLKQYVVGGSEFDPANLTFQTRSLDSVFLLQALEFYKYDKAILNEALRVLKDDGVLVVVLENINHRGSTHQWEVANNGRIRSYGRDAGKYLKDALPSAVVYRVPLSDPVTGEEDTAFLVAQSLYSECSIIELFPKSRIV